MRKIISLSISPEIIAWVDEKVNSRAFRSRSHAVEKILVDEKVRESVEN
jgi:Arc/MetJ-type ribon-helix-helix transcriptional regulator